MRTLLVLLSVVAFALALPTLAAGDEAPWVGVTLPDDGYVAPPCDDPDVNTLAAADCAGIVPVPSLDPDYAENPPTVESLSAAAAARAATEPSADELPEYCRLHARVYFYTASDWLRLGQKLAANASPCADYYITIPPLAADKTGLRCPADRDQQDDLVRALGPRFHPVVEFHFQGWRNWWRAVPGRTPADAAREFLRKVRDDCHYDFSNGETWSLNELHSGIAANNPGARADMREVIGTLAAGLPGLPASRGIVWVIGVGQGTLNFSVYKPRLKEWLQDTAFWEDMARDVLVWGQETYPNMLFWGNADTSRHARTSNLSLFLEHPLLLAEAGPPSVATALAFLEQSYVPLASAAWPYASGFGNTLFPDLEMKRFIAEQTFALKHFSQTRPHAAPDARFAMAWAPNSQCGTELCTPVSVLNERSAGILDRLASGIRESYELGGGSQAGACGPPGDHTWCTADITDADFNPLWSTFLDW